MNFAKRLRLRVLVLLMISGGILCSFYLAGTRIATAVAQMQYHQQSLSKINELEAIAQLVPLLQQERGMSAGFLTSGGTAFATELPQQRERVDQVITEAAASLQSLTAQGQAGDVPASAQEIADLLDRLGRMRNLIDQQALAPADQIAFYTQLTEGAANLSQQIANEMSSAEVILAMSLFSSLQSALDSAGIERAVGSGGFATDTFSEARIARLSGLVATQKALLDQASRFGTDREQETLFELRFGDASSEIEGYRAAYTTNDRAVIEATSGEVWFAAATRRIDALMDVKWSVFERARTETSALLAVSRAQMTTLVGTLAAIVLATLTLTILLYRTMMRQFRDQITAISGLAEGNLNVSIPEVTPNEFGQIASALHRFKQNAEERATLEEAAQRSAEMQQRVVADLRGALSQLAHGNLVATLHNPFEESYEELRRDFNSACGNLRSSLIEVDETASMFSQKSTTMDAVTVEIAQQAEEQATALATSVASLDQLTSTVADAAKTAARTAEETQGARNLATNSREVVELAIASISDVEGASSKISRIVDVIDDLSFQTNLLALNAGVEAARAGESGKGFAVVAQEVGALAQRSADSAMEIRELIKASAESVSQSVERVRQTEEALGNVIDKVADVSDGINDIADASRRQSDVLSQINQSLLQIEKMTSNTAETVTSNKAVSASLLEGATDLKQTLARFEIGADWQNAEPQKIAS